MADFNLPNEIWCMIFSNLPLELKKNASATCKLWFRLIREDQKLSEYILISWHNMEKAIDKLQWNWNNWPVLKTLELKSLPLKIVDSREAIQSAIQKLPLKDLPPSLEVVLFDVDLTASFKYFTKFTDMVICVKYHPYTDQIIGFKQVLDSIKACKGDESTMNALVKLSQATVSQATASQESVVSKYEGRWRPVPRAVPGPEVREPDVFLSGCRTFLAFTFYTKVVPRDLIL